jgi:hypothetical protein
MTKSALAITNIVDVLCIPTNERCLSSSIRILKILALGGTAKHQIQLPPQFLREDYTILRSLPPHGIMSLVLSSLKQQPLLVFGCESFPWCGIQGKGYSIL